MQEQLRIREVLSKAEEELNPTNSWPIDITAILRYLGIRLELKVSNNEKSAAHLVINDRPSIVIISRSGDDPLTSNFNRFSIAHEIGHWIVWRRFGFTPRSTAEYWVHERLCNEFAGNLLVPCKALSPFLGELRERGVHPLHFPRNVATAAQVSWQVAARSISAIPNFEYWYVRFASVDESRLLVNCSTVDDGNAYIGERAKVCDTELSNWLRNLPVGQIASLSVSFVAGAFRIRAGQASFLRERAQFPSLRAAMLTIRARTEVLRTTVKEKPTPLGTTGEIGVT